MLACFVFLSFLVLYSCGYFGILSHFLLGEKSDDGSPPVLMHRWRFGGSWTIDLFLQPPADTFIWGQAGFVIGENLCILSPGSNA